MKILSILCVVAFLTGCQTPAKQFIRFDSEPVGARVFYGMHANEKLAEPKTYLGQTPFSWAPEQDGGEFEIPGIIGYSKFVPRVIVFEARPADCATCNTQRVIFHGGALGHDADKIPPGVFFDLRPRP